MHHGLQRHDEPDDRVRVDERDVPGVDGHDQGLGLRHAPGLGDPSERRAPALPGHPGLGPDWNIQGIQVIGTERGGGTQDLLDVLPVSADSDCVARLKGFPNASTVSFTLDGTDGHTYTDGNEAGETSSCSNNGG